jgi:hypothetical protein
VSATFSEPIDPATLTAATFLVRTTNGNTPVTGTVTYTAATRVAEFTPGAALASSTGYTATITTAVKDVAGNQLAADFNLSFTTRDEIPPTVSSVSPANGATNVSTSVTVVATFSEAMDATTINGSTVTLKQTSSGAAVSGTVTYNSGARTVSFTPSAALSNTTSYTLTISAAAKDTAGNAMAAAFSSGFTTKALADTTPPDILTTSPLNGAAGVATDAIITITFSEALAPATVNSSTISLRVTGSGPAIAGTVTYNSASGTATLTPSSALSNNTSYTVTVSAGIKDLAGNPLPSLLTFNFLTVAPGTPPTVIASVPAGGATNVAVTSPVSVTFSKDMDASTINGATFILRMNSTGADVAGTVSYDPGTRAAAFTPAAGLLANGIGYTATVTTAARDIGGLGLSSNFIFSFTTVPDATPPTVTSTSPANGTTNVAVSTSVTATFSKAMDAATINGTAFTLKVASSGVLVSGSVSYNAGSRMATFAPSSPLANATSYTGTITTGARDASGIPFANNFDFTFITAAAPPPPGQNVSGQPYFQGTDPDDRIHFHISFNQSGQNLSVASNCQPLPLANCAMFPLNPDGAAAIGPPSPGMNGGAMIVAISGTLTDPGINFAVTLENGRTFNFTGTVSNSNAMTLVVSGATLSATNLTMTR